MNLQQLDYIIAVDTHRHFLQASKKCFVTQASLSMMIQKLEEELGVKVFDRSKNAVKPSDIGRKIIHNSYLKGHVGASSLETHEVLHAVGSFLGEILVADIELFEVVNAFVVGVVGAGEQGRDGIAERHRIVAVAKDNGGKKAQGVACVLESGHFEIGPKPPVGQRGDVV